MPALERWVYSFGDGRADGSAAMRDILGGKGAGLAEMANLGLPVPPGFTISAKLCIAYLEQGTFPDDLREEVDRQLKQLERASKKRFGDARDPLLVSVRSEEHTSELQSLTNLVCRLLLEKKKKKKNKQDQTRPRPDSSR